MAELEFEFIRPAPDRFHSHPVRLTGEQGPHGKQPRRPGTGSEGQVSGGRGRRASYQEPASSCLFSSLNRSRWPKLGMGRPVMLTLQDKDVKGFTWAIAPALTSLGYLLILLVSVFPFWVRLVNEESHEVFFSGLFENCFHIKCWKPRPLSVYIILGRVFLLSAVVLSFLTTFILVSFASQLFPRTRKHNLVSAFISFLTGWPRPYPGRLPSHGGGGTLTVGNQVELHPKHHTQGAPSGVSQRHGHRGYLGKGFLGSVPSWPCCCMPWRSRI
ncbi:transmembrane protein 225B isoform X4 [Ursus maritimus]|uniref:Transmembrane protein 225B isoform X4 n=1 Tax=Ursus maritimus TaxID=29073 RepID=A0A8M1G543_URSMA|nr:transmembrane protein 225B isoform X4 [Ursus maritimus]XP_057171223.1 transmembrane protein 225B isoform X4 [Ursus arctos]